MRAHIGNAAVLDKIYLGQTEYEVVYVGALRRLDNLLVRYAFDAVGDVLFDRAIEQYLHM